MRPLVSTYFQGKILSVLFVACKGLTKVDDSLSEEQLRDEQYITVQDCTDSPSITEGLEVGKTYKCEEDEWFSVARKWGEFGHWVSQLSYLVGGKGEIPSADSDIAFRDLFRFGLHQGTFGPVASAKFAADFATWDERAKSFADENFYPTYTLVRKMFEYAAKDGLVYLRCY